MCSDWCDLGQSMSYSSIIPLLPEAACRIPPTALLLQVAHYHPGRICAILEHISGQLVACALVDSCLQYLVALHSICSQHADALAGHPETVQVLPAFFWFQQTWYQQQIAPNACMWFTWLTVLTGHSIDCQQQLPSQSCNCPCWMCVLCYPGDVGCFAGGQQ